MKFPRWTQNLMLVGLGVALALGLGLIGARLLGRGDDAQALLSAPCQPEPGDWRTLVEPAVKDYRSPCTEFYWLEMPGGEFHNRIRLNNFGLHDTALTLEKPPGVYRILIVGDSFPQGWQVKLQEGFPWLLERQLNQDSRRPVEVINLSVDSYGTDRELLLYAAFGWRFQADLVLLSVYMGNDIQDNEINLEQRRYGYRLDRAFFTLKNEDVLQMHNGPEFYGPQFPESAAFQWLAEMGKNQLPPPPYEVPENPPLVSENPYLLAYPVEVGLYLPEDRHWSNAWATTEALIRQFRDLALKQQSLFAAVIIPDRRAVHEDDWQLALADYPIPPGTNPLLPGSRMEDFLSEQGIPNLNLTLALRQWAAENPDERLYYVEDGHFNSSGHAVSAEAIYKWIRASNLAP
jgi:hypothetical protein